jgi:hypothetical protein
MILQCKKVNISSIRTDGKKDDYISFDRAWRALSIAQLISFKNGHFRKKKFDIMDNMLPTGLVSGYFNHSISILPSKWIWYSESASKTESDSILFCRKKFCQTAPVLPLSFFKIILFVVPRTCGFGKKDFFSVQKNTIRLSFWCWFRITYSFWWQNGNGMVKIARYEPGW